MIVYRHRRLDTNKVFYIVIGSSEKRAYTRKGRNNHWCNVVNKAGYEVDILLSGLTRDEACELEIFLIKEYGRYDLGEGDLVNKTDGGEGIVNCSKELRELRSNQVKGDKNPTYGKPRTDEVKNLISEKNKGRKSKIAKQLSKYLFSLDNGETFLPVSEASKKLGYSDVTTLRKFAAGIKENNKLKNMIINGELIIKKNK